MRNPFEDPSVARHLKIAVSGPPGSGKTCLGLDAKNHGLGPVAVLSLEAGEAQYARHARWGGFRVLRTQTLGEMQEALAYLEQNPKAFGTLVVDTVTGIYEACVDSKQEDDGSMNRNSWGLVKRAWKSLMLRLVNLPLHIVFVVHELDITETDKAGNTRVVGQKLDAEKTFARAPDFWLRLTQTAGAKPTAQVMKVRGDDTGLSVGQKIVDPSLGLFVAAIKGGASEARVSLPEEVAQQNAASLSSKSKPAPEPEKASEQAAALSEPGSIAALEASIAAIDNLPHWRNWRAKHRPEVNALDADAKRRIVDAYNLRGEVLKQTAPEREEPPPPTEPPHQSEEQSNAQQEPPPAAQGA